MAPLKNLEDQKLEVQNQADNKGQGCTWTGNPDQDQHDPSEMIYFPCLWDTCPVLVGETCPNKDQGTHWQHVVEQRPDLPEE
jgi:hypothetical protein